MAIGTRCYALYRVTHCIFTAQRISKSNQRPPPLPPPLVLANRSVYFAGAPWKNSAFYFVLRSAKTLWRTYVPRVYMRCALYVIREFGARFPCFSARLAASIYFAGLITRVRDTRYNLKFYVIRSEAL